MTSKREDHASLKRIKTGGNTYECDVCNKRFSHSGHLTEHKRTHSGDKPYECDVCQKKFLNLNT